MVNLLSITLLVAGAALPLLAGCASTGVQSPYALTGDQRDKHAFTSDKGAYRPDWAAGDQSSV